MHNCYFCKQLWWFTFLYPLTFTFHIEFYQQVFLLIIRNSAVSLHIIFFLCSKSKLTHTTILLYVTSLYHAVVNLFIFLFQTKPKPLQFKNLICLVFVRLRFIKIVRFACHTKIVHQMYVDYYLYYYSHFYLPLLDITFLYK